ncbi:hypothetical protein OG230_02135 [Streptomyces sp. NBC_00234]|uniref:hypothetical protein n=1 Tax=Streptomyces sp. NBC_00234 TaxID=2903638 RepID=UPI002E2B57F0|nr:hypothetical protein [Streptomyces sp. NBC_00234]
MTGAESSSGQYSQRGSLRSSSIASTALTSGHSTGTPGGSTFAEVCSTSPLRRLRGANR